MYIIPVQFVEIDLLGNVRVSQIVNPKKTARVEMPLIKTAGGWKIRTP